MTSYEMFVLFYFWYVWSYSQKYMCLLRFALRVCPGFNSLENRSDLRTLRTLDIEIEC